MHIFAPEGKQDRKPLKSRSHEKQDEAYSNRRGAGRRELEIFVELCDTARIAEDLPARGRDGRVLQHGSREVHFRASEHGEVPGGLVVAPRPAYAVLLRVEDRRRTRRTPVDSVEVVP